MVPDLVDLQLPGHVLLPPVLVYHEVGVADRPVPGLARLLAPVAAEGDLAAPAAVDQAVPPEAAHAATVVWLAQLAGEQRPLFPVSET